MREALAASVGSSNLKFDPEYERAADRVAAIGFGPRLGSLLIRYRDANQVRWEREIIARLAKRIIRKLPITHSIAAKVAECALSEWARPHCATCGGARVIMGAMLKVVCPACDGIGVRRYTNSERRRIIGAWGGMVSDGYDLALATITGAVAATVGIARDKLCGDC